ncbi:MAG TPA: PP0621 family protein [Terriglobales bacterium]|nr:PP0621 family protein [Terriglobales bacterium]
MSRLIFLAAIVAVIYLLLKSYRGRNPTPKQQAPDRAEDMVRCAQCGVHLPRSESILADGKYYCSEAHRREHQSTSKGA